MSHLILKVLILICFSVVKGEEGSTAVNRAFPKCSDLNIYVTALEKATIFCSNINNMIDTNLAYGIFLSRVNVERALLLKLPKSLRKRIRVLAGDIKWLSHILPIHSGDPFNRASVLSGLKKFNAHRRLYDYLLGNIEEIFPSMEQYERRVLNLRASMPSPALSDHCINEVLNNPKTGNFSRCFLHPDCREALIFGDNYGYGLTHRVLLMMMMHQSRSCFAFTESEDHEIIQRLCSYMYHEAKYIIDNEGMLLDLVIENSVLCAQMGYDIFLNRHWMKSVLLLQSPHGCFRKMDIAKRPTARHDKTGQSCDQHLTAVTMANLSILIRYLTENCFSGD